MAGKLDWLLGDYYIYRHVDLDSKIVEYQISYTKMGNGRIKVYLNYGPEFSYSGTLSVVGNNLCSVLKRSNHEEFVMLLFPKPNTEYINLLWGVAAGTIPRGNLPAASKILKSRQKLTLSQAQNEFIEAGVTHQNGLMVVDYNVEEKNRPQDSSCNIEDITQQLLQKSLKARKLMHEIQGKDE